MLITRSERSKSRFGGAVKWNERPRLRGCRTGKCGNAILKSIRVFGNPADLNARTDFVEPANIATDQQTEKPDDDQIQDPRCGSCFVDDDGNAAVRAGRYPGARRVRILPSRRGRFEWRPAHACCLRRRGIGSVRRQRRLCLHGRQRERLVLRSALPFLRSGFGYLPRL